MPLLEWNVMGESRSYTNTNRTMIFSRSMLDETLVVSQIFT